MKDYERKYRESVRREHPGITDAELDDWVHRVNQYITVVDQITRRQAREKDEERSD